jgi:hypothetical protein
MYSNELAADLMGNTSMNLGARAPGFSNFGKKLLFENLKKLK